MVNTTYYGDLATNIKLKTEFLGGSKRGGMTYQRAVDSEILISAFERIRAGMMARDLEASRPDTPARPETAVDVLLRGLKI